MAEEPSYPKDAAVGAESGETEGKPAAPKRTKHMVTGAAIGIGSAAIVAALLYANRSKRNDEGS